MPEAFGASAHNGEALSVAVHDRLASISEHEWNDLLPCYPDSHAYVALLDDAGMDGFSFKSLVVSDAQGPLLYLPLFVHRLNVASLLDGMAGKIAGAVTRFAPGLTSVSVLGIGLVEGEWLEPGVRTGAQANVMAAAWRLVNQTLQELQQKDKSPVTAWLNGRTDTLDLLPTNLVAESHTLAAYPCALLSLPFETVDEYIASLGSSTRKDLRRKMRAADAMDIRVTRDVSAYVDSIERLYAMQVSKADLALGRHRRAFFEQVTQRVPGSYYALYFDRGELIAFNLLIRRGSALVDKYFAMEPIAGRQHHLYFASWLFNVESCIQQGISVYHAGPGSEATKARLGCRFVKTATRFQHRNRLMDFALRRLAGSFAYVPEIDADALRWHGRLPDYGLTHDVTRRAAVA